MQLIAIQDRAIGAEQQSVNARDLYTFLGLARDFNAWITDAIARARLAPSRDYLLYEDVGNPAGGRPRKECALTIDSAKHIAMMSGTERGFEAREYFIECERRAHAAPSPAPALNDPATLRGLLLNYTEQVLQLETKIEEQKPAVEFVNRYVDANGSKGFREVCKLLRANEREFSVWLIDREIMYRLGGKLTPRQKHIDAGRFEIKAGVNIANDHAFNQTRFTTKGVTWIAGEWGKRLVAA